MGWDSSSYDPFVDVTTNVRDIRTYDLVTAVEVFEHVPDLQVLLEELDGVCRPDGLMVFSTLLSDGHIAHGRKPSWWYASPRNGHISLFSTKSPTRWMSSKGLRVASVSANVHLAYRTLPPWAAHLGAPA